LGSTLELGVATAFLAHIGVAFAEIRQCPIPSDVIGPLYHDADLVLDGAQIRDGAVIAPAGPGLGISLDLDQLNRYLR
jgi:muconate cycloisomerase